MKRMLPVFLLIQMEVAFTGRCIPNGLTPPFLKSPLRLIQMRRRQIETLAMQRNAESQSSNEPQPAMHSHVDIVYLISYINCKAWEYQKLLRTPSGQEKSVQPQQDQIPQGRVNIRLIPACGVRRTLAFQAFFVLIPIIHRQRLRVGWQNK